MLRPYRITLVLCSGHLLCACGTIGSSDLSARRDELNPTRPVAEASRSDVRQVSAVITSYGIYDGGVEVSRANPNVPSGRTTATHGKYLVEQTSAVPLKLGTHFGFCYTVSGLSPGVPGVIAMVSKDVRAVFEMLVEFPPQAPPNGKSSSGYKSRASYPVINGQVKQCHGLDFGEPWQLVAGVYRFTLLFDSQPIASQAFVAR